MFSFDVLVNDFPFDFFDCQVEGLIVFYVVNQLSGRRMNVVLMPSITVSRV